jgi:hypothetical protein
VIVRRLIVPLTLAVIAVTTAQAVAQDAVPAPPPGAASERDSCVNGFAPLREEAEQRGRLIKAASARHASPDEACKLIGAFSQAELKMINYVEIYSAKCEIAPELADRLKTGHRTTEVMLGKVCAAAAQQTQKPGPAGPVGDFDTVR